LDDVKYEAYLLKGEAGVLIPELAQAKAVDLIVMGTVSRTGVAGLLIGNTAEKVLRRVDCSVLTVKPEGFISPVKQEPE
jgi:universal stress protein E